MSLNEEPPQVAKKIHSTLKTNPKEGLNQLHDLLDCILNPIEDDSMKNTVQWLKALICDGVTWDQFCKIVMEKDDSPCCGIVWTSNFVAYRCRTCATSPCMSLCAACFERGNHEGHDYNMFRSEAGGACDCGDPHVMSPSGFCPRHGPDRIKPQQVPENFISTAKVVLERMVIYLFYTIRKFSQQGSSITVWEEDVSDEFKQFLAFFHVLIQLGSPIISIISEVMLSEEIYFNFKKCQGYLFFEKPDVLQFHKTTVKYFKDAVQGMSSPAVPVGIDNEVEFGKNRMYTRFIDELAFWIVDFEFLEPLILFVLNLLPNARMKKEFSVAFINHYSRIARNCQNPRNKDANKLAERIVHVSVQLFSNEEIAFQLAQNNHLVEVFIISLHNVICMNIVPSKTSKFDNHYVVAIPSDRNKQNAYWPIASDFTNLMGHRSVCKHFISDRNLLKPWCNMLLKLSGMDLNERQLSRHVEFDNSIALSYYYLVREVCAAPLNCILEVLTDKSTLHLSIQLVDVFLETFDSFLNSIGYDDNRGIASDQISFHFPLHRYISLIISNAMKRQEATLEDFKITWMLAKRLMQHPFQLLVTSVEISANMWVRNGLQIQTQNYAYKQHMFSNFYVDADLFLLQVCASIIPGNFVVMDVFKRARVITSLTSNEPYSQITSNLTPEMPDEDRQPIMLEGALRLICNILSNSQNFDISDEDLLTREVVNLLASRPRTFSNLHDNIAALNDSGHSVQSQQGLCTALLKKTLQKVALKREAKDAMEQTSYVLKPESWNHYDPIFNEHRTLYKRDLQEAFKGYHANLINTRVINKDVPMTHLWPPYKELKKRSDKYNGVLNILCCDSLHSAIYFILLKFYNGNPLVTETTLSFAIHLLKSALQISETPYNFTTVQTCSLDLDFFACFKTKSIWSKLTENFKKKDENATDLSLKDCENLLTLIIMIYNKQTKNYFDLPPDVFSTVDIEPPTLSNTIKNLLYYIAASSPYCMNAMRCIINKLKPDGMEISSQSGSTTDTMLKKLRARLAREAMMKKIRKDANSFTKKAFRSESREAKSTEEPSTSDFNKDQSMETESDDDNPKCVICHLGRITSTKTEESLHSVQQSATPSTSTFIINHDVRTTTTIFPQTPTNEQEASIDTESASQVEEMDIDDDLDDITAAYDGADDDTANFWSRQRRYTGSVQQTHKTENYSFGLVCYVQESQVTGTKRHSSGRINYDSKENVCTTSDIIQEDLKQLTKTSYKTKLEVIASETCCHGVHISTCGHYVHHKCMEDYLRSVGNGNTSYENVIQNGFQCPMCRSQSNFILPVDFDDKINMRESYPELLVMKIYKALYEDAPDFPDKLEYYFHGILRYNINVRLMQCQEEFSQSNIISLIKGLSTDTSHTTFDKMLVKRSVPIRDLYKMFVKVAISERETDVYLHSISKELPQPTNISLLSRLSTKETNMLSNDMPILFCDPMSLFLSILPREEPESVDYFHQTFFLVYRMAYIKSLVFVLRHFSEEERNAWKQKVCTEESASSNKSHFLLNQIVASLLNHTTAEFFANDELSSRPTDICLSRPGAVFSPQSVITHIEKMMESFLKQAALLKYEMFGITCEDLSCKYLDSTAKVYAKFLGVFPENSINVELHSLFELKEIDSLINKWLYEINNKPPSIELTRQLILRGISYQPENLPTLINLPKNYKDFFSFYRNQKCRYCNKEPSSPVVCLVCGFVCCYKNKDCKVTLNQATLHSTCRHALECGRRTSVFMLVNSAHVIVVRPTRYLLWGTVYLDGNGEEDLGWRRGKPLYLQEKRLELLEKQWRRNLFEFVYRQWQHHLQSL